MRGVLGRGFKIAGAMGRGVTVGEISMGVGDVGGPSACTMPVGSKMELGGRGGVRLKFVGKAMYG